ncbi:MAG: ABC transporter substrate-binding protein [Gammaproteobacteria bacterium]|nr:ABC transporter substrate-binding protein [Gammaproteobacteria bacterium]
MFHLRKDVKWHPYNNKRENFTAKDVVNTVAIMQHPKTISSKKEDFENIFKAEAINENQVKFILKNPAINPIAIFNFKILPHHVLKDHAFLNKANKFTNNPVGTGPYIFTNSNSNRQITLTANNDYYKGKPNISTIILKPYSDKNIMNQALSFNNLDMIVSVSPRHLSELQADARFSLNAYNTLSYSFFAYNQNNEHLKIQKVRKAISHGINREEMLRAFFNNQGTIISGPFAPGSWAYNLDVMPDDYNPLKSIALLKEAGYTQTSKGFMDAKGKFLVFRLRVPIEKNNEATKRVVLAYKNFMKKIGIKINVDFMEREGWKRAIFKEHKFDITYASWSFDDSSDISTLFHSASNIAWGNNFISYNNPEVDKLIEQSQASIDHQEKRTINHRLHKIISQDVPYTFLWSLTHYAAYNKRLSDVKIHPYQFFDDVHLWKKN